MKRLAASLLLSAVASASLADAVPALREVLLDNQAVEVVRLTYPVGSESGMHTHQYPNRVAYVVKGGVLEMIAGDSAQDRRTVEVLEGQAIWLPAATHNIRNVGDSDVVIIETEIK